MTPWLSQHLAALRLALYRLAVAPLNTALSLLAIGIALALPAGGQMLLGNALRLASQATPQPQLTVFMLVEADPGEVKKVADRLRQHEQIKALDFVPRDATLARMKQSGGLKDVIEVLGRNPFPDAFVVTPRRDDADAMEALAAELRKLPRVEHVQLDSAWVRRMDALLKLGRTGVGLLALLLGAGLTAITFNIIRLQVLTLRAEIEVSRLLGATDAFIRRPFLYFGSLLGLFGGIAALGLVAAAAAWLKAPMTELVGLYGLQLDFTGLPLRESALLLLLATALGFSGATLSLRQQLKED